MSQIDAVSTLSQSFSGKAGITFYNSLYDEGHRRGAGWYESIPEKHLTWERVKSGQMSQNVFKTKTWKI